VESEAIRGVELWSHGVVVCSCSCGAVELWQVASGK
jgi:hypothetical protein